MVLGGAVADRIDRRRILLTSHFIQMTMAAALGAALRHRPSRASPPSCSSPSSPASRSRSRRPPTRPCSRASCPRPHSQRRGPELPAVQPLALHRPGHRRPSPGPAGTGPCFAVNALSFLAVIVALLRHRISLGRAHGAHESLGESLKDGAPPCPPRAPCFSCSPCSPRRQLPRFPPAHLPARDRGRRAGDRRRRLLPAALELRPRARSWGPSPRPSGARSRAGAACWPSPSPSTGSWPWARWPRAGRASPWPSCPIAGASLVTAFSTLNSLVQENAPDALRGRVLSIFGLAFRGGMPAGQPPRRRPGRASRAPRS